MSAESSWRERLGAVWPYFAIVGVIVVSLGTIALVTKAADYQRAQFRDDITREVTRQGFSVVDVLPDTHGDYSDPKGSYRLAEVIVTVDSCKPKLRGQIREVPGVGRRVQMQLPQGEDRYIDLQSDQDLRQRMDLVRCVPHPEQVVTG